MTRLERFRLAIVRQGFTGVVCTGTPCGCDPNGDFAPCLEGSRSTDEVAHSCRGGYRHHDPEGRYNYPVFSTKKEPLTRDEFDEIASRS